MFVVAVQRKSPMLSCDNEPPKKEDVQESLSLKVLLKRELERLHHSFPKKGAA